MQSNYAIGVSAVSTATSARPIVQHRFELSIIQQPFPKPKKLAQHARALPRTTRLMNGLGLYWQERGHFGAAEPLYRRALAISERSDGSEHPNVATALNNLALLLKATNHEEEFERQ